MPGIAGQRRRPGCVLLRITGHGRLLLNQDRNRRTDQLAGAIDAELNPAEREQLARAVELLQRLTARIEHN